MEQTKKAYETIGGGNPFWDMRISIPGGDLNVTPEEREAYRRAGEACVNQDIYRLTRAFYILEAETLQRYDIHTMDIPLYGLMVYEAGRAQGKQEERARQKARR